MSAAPRPRVLSGMRPTGMLHLGHNFLLRKWVELQDSCACSYFIADYHALTTTAGGALELASNTRDMVVCWLAAGIDPERAVIFQQSQLREHAELHVMLSMVAPLPWLERVPHYKDVAAKEGAAALNYGFLGYPVLQAADIIAHAADLVPVGDDQEAHVELTARLARAFNARFGQPAGWQDQAEELIGQLPAAAEFQRLCRQVGQDGDEQARAAAQAMVEGAALGREATQVLRGWIDGTGRQVLRPPRALKAEVSRLPGLDGGKMSKSDNNDIGMLEERASHTAKVKAMPTDPARVRRSDPGDPDRCPVFDYHRLFTAGAQRDEIRAGCTSASMGCVDCKGRLSTGIDGVIAPLRDRAAPWLAQPRQVDELLHAGNERARADAAAVLAEARQAVGLPQVA